MTERPKTVTVTLRSSVWLSAIDELGWRRAGLGTENINWPQVKALIDAVRVHDDEGSREV